MLAHTAPNSVCLPKAHASLWELVVPYQCPTKGICRLAMCTAAARTCTHAHMHSAANCVGRPRYRICAPPSGLGRRAATGVHARTSMCTLASAGVFNCGAWPCMQSNVEAMCRGIVAHAQSLDFLVGGNHLNSLLVRDAYAPGVLWPGAATCTRGAGQHRATGCCGVTPCY